MVHNPYLTKGQTCIFRYSEKNMWPQYLCVNIDIDENNWLFKNTDGFNLFSFIVNEGKLISDKHLVFYNNLKDPDLIVHDISEAEGLEKEELLSYDNVLMLNLNKLKNGQSIKIYCQFNRRPETENKSLLGKLFKKEEKKQTIRGDISFHFLEQNYYEWGWPSYGHGQELNLCIELLELHKIDEESCKMTCILQVSDTNLEKMIEKYLNAANSV
jgi:hypothetical protein